jgi:hypothetical protein
MGTKRVGLARTQALIENLKRELQMNGTSLAGLKEKTLTTTADKTLTVSDSGKTIFLDGSTTHDVTLPAAATGLTFTFFLVDATADVDIVQGATATEDFVGNITAHNGKDTASASDTKIIFDQSGGAAVGDWVQVTCYNDDDWYVVGLSNTSAAVVFG